MPILSVVLPTYNRLPQLLKVLAGLEVQSEPLSTFEVIVVSDGSTDGTDEFLRTYSTPLQLRLFCQTNGGAAAARNLGITMARGEIVLFLDDDVVPAPQLIAEHLATHRRHNGNVVVLGPMLTPQDFVFKPWVRWEQAMLYKQYADMTVGRWQPTARQFYTGNASLARRYLTAVGGFDTTFRRAEDVELAYRLANQGVTFSFNPQAVGYHYADRSFASWLQTPYHYGRNDVIFARDRNQPWLLSTVLEEFHQRHFFIKALTRLCLSRQRVSAAVIRGLQYMAAVSHAAGIARLSDHAYSGIFNLCYYQGMADELQGRQPFFHLTRQAATAHELHQGLDGVAQTV